MKPTLNLKCSDTCSYGIYLVHCWYEADWQIKDACTVTFQGPFIDMTCLELNQPLMILKWTILSPSHCRPRNYINNPKNIAILLILCCLFPDLSCINLFCHVNHLAMAMQLNQINEPLNYSDHYQCLLFSSEQLWCFLKAFADFSVSFDEMTLTFPKWCSRSFVSFILISEGIFFR